MATAAPSRIHRQRCAFLRARLTQTICGPRQHVLSTNSLQQLCLYQTPTSTWNRQSKSQKCILPRPSTSHFWLSVATSPRTWKIRSSRMAVSPSGLPPSTKFWRRGHHRGRSSNAKRELKKCWLARCKSSTLRSKLNLLKTRRCWSATLKWYQTRSSFLISDTTRSWTSLCRR